LGIKAQIVYLAADVRLKQCFCLKFLLFACIISPLKGVVMPRVTHSNSDEKKRSSEIDAFVRNLSTEHKMLVVLKAELYGNSWITMSTDLKNRLEGKPYIFKLANRISDDIERIEEMRKFEEKYGINLTDYVNSVE